MKPRSSTAPKQNADANSAPDISIWWIKGLIIQAWKIIGGKCSSSGSNFNDSQREGKKNIQMALSAASRPGRLGPKGYFLLNKQTYLILKTSFRSFRESVFLSSPPFGNVRRHFPSSFSDQIFCCPDLWRVKKGRDTIKSLIRRMKWSGVSITAS